MWLDTLRKWIIGGGPERLSPGAWIPWSAIKLEGDKLVVQLRPGVQYRLLGVGPSGSMDPVLDDGIMTLLADVVEGTPITADDLIAGDIAVYRKPNGIKIRHRLVKVGYDELGRFFRFKGDNPITNWREDRRKVRDSEIVWVVQAIFHAYRD